MTDTTGEEGASVPESSALSVAPPKAIVVGVDGSPASAYATRWVAALAASLDARVILVNAVSAVNDLLNDSLLYIMGTSNWRNDRRRRMDLEWAQPL